MGKRNRLGLLLLALLAVPSCSNVPGTSSVIQNVFFQLSETFDFNHPDYNALFRNKRVLPGCRAVVKNEMDLAGLSSNESPTESSTPEQRKAETATQTKRNEKLVFGGVSYLLVGKV